MTMALLTWKMIEMMIYGIREREWTFISATALLEHFWAAYLGQRH